MRLLQETGCDTITLAAYRGQLIRTTLTIGTGGLMHTKKPQRSKHYRTLCVYTTINTSSYQEAKSRLFVPPSFRLQIPPGILDNTYLSQLPSYHLQSWILFYNKPHVCSTFRLRAGTSHGLPTTLVRLCLISSAKLTKELLDFTIIRGFSTMNSTILFRVTIPFV